MFYKVVPLSAGFMLSSIIGAIVSIFYISNINEYIKVISESTANTWGFAFFLFFTLMFIASMVSMTLAPIDAEFDIKKEKNRIKKK